MQLTPVVLLPEPAPTPCGLRAQRGSRIGRGLQTPRSAVAIGGGSAVAGSGSTVRPSRHPSPPVQCTQTGCTTRREGGRCTKPAPLLARRLSPHAHVGHEVGDGHSLRLGRPGPVGARRARRRPDASPGNGVYDTGEGNRHGGSKGSTAPAPTSERGGEELVEEGALVRRRLGRVRGVGRRDGLPHLALLVQREARTRVEKAEGRVLVIGLRVRLQARSVGRATR